MQYKGLFWSAVVRAILSLRRDQGKAEAADTTGLAALNELETGLTQQSQLEQLLTALCPPADRHLLGRSLIGYFDFNKMGNLVVYAMATRNIQAAMACFVPRAQQLFHSEVALTKDEEAPTVALQWQASNSALIDDLQIYFLFALFRHLAGRHFDFSAIGSPHDAAGSLLAPLSQSKRLQDTQIHLRFASEWCLRPSFYHSQAIEKLLAPTLSQTEVPSIKQSLHNVFAKAEAPARIRAEWVAEQMGQTESGLRRLLRSHNIAFSAMLKEYIHDKSCQKLLGGSKTDDTAVELGFSDRRSFERSFKEFSGISAGQLRQLGNRLRFHKGNHSLLEIVDNLPPLPATIQSLLAMDDDNMTLKSVVKLVSKDPIFQAHVMSKASKAIYGSAPENLEQAIGRNLGLSNIKQLAVLFAAQQQLTAQCRHNDVEKLTDAMLLCLPVFNAIEAEHSSQLAVTEELRQIMLFSTLSLFLVFHDKCLFVDGVMRTWDEAEDFAHFVAQVSEEFGICLYGATSLMLLRWGFQSSINQQLWKLCQAIEAPASAGVAGKILTTQNVSFTASAMSEQHSEAVLATLPPAAIARVSTVLQQWKG